MHVTINSVSNSTADAPVSLRSDLTKGYLSTTDYRVERNRLRPVTGLAAVAGLAFMAVLIGMPSLAGLGG